MDLNDYFDQQIENYIYNDKYNDFEILISNSQDINKTEEIDLNEFNINSENKEEEIIEIKDKKKDVKKNKLKNITNKKCYFYLYKYNVINNSETLDNKNIKKPIKVINKEKNICNEFIKPSSNFINCNNISLTKVKNVYFISNLLKKHDIFSVDNKIRKIKSFMINILIIYANNYLINTHETDDYGKKIKKQILLTIEAKISNNTKVEYNKALMKIKIKEILSSPITKKIKNCERDHNEKVIEKYYEKNYVKKIVSFFDSEFKESFIYLKDKANENFKDLEIIYKNQLKPKKEVDRKIIEENILDFVETINTRKGKKTNEK